MSMLKETPLVIAFQLMKINSLLAVINWLLALIQSTQSLSYQQHNLFISSVLFREGGGEQGFSLCAAPSKY